MVMTRGDADLFTRIFLSKLRACRQMVILSITDGDRSGYGMTHRLRYGSQSAYFYLNEKLSMPEAIRIGLHPFHLLLDTVGSTLINAGQKMEQYEAVIRVAHEKNSWFNQDSFDFNHELIEYNTMNLIYNREAEAMELNPAITLRMIRDLFTTFSKQELRYTMTNGLDYFRVQNRLETFFLKYYNSIEHFPTINLHRFGVAPIYVRKFNAIFNASGRFAFKMQNPIFNSRLNTHFIFEWPTVTTGIVDLQIMQSSSTDYFLIMAYFDPDPNADADDNAQITVFGMLNYNNFARLSIEPVIKERYGRDEIQYVSLNRWFRGKSELSGLICCYVAAIQQPDRIQNNHLQFEPITAAQLTVWFDNIVANNRL